MTRKQSDDATMNRAEQVNLYVLFMPSFIPVRSILFKMYKKYTTIFREKFKLWYNYVKLYWDAGCMIANVSACSLWR